MRGAVQLALHAEYLHLPATHDVHVATPRQDEGGGNTDMLSTSLISAKAFLALTWKQTYTLIPQVRRGLALCSRTVLCAC